MSVTIAAYQDILHCSRPVSKRPKMSVENRAKLFTPFAALRGFDIEILTTEQDRLLVPQVLLSADQQEANRQAQRIREGGLGNRHLFSAGKVSGRAASGGVYGYFRGREKGGRCGTASDSGGMLDPLWQHPHPGGAGDGGG